MEPTLIRKTCTLLLRLWSKPLARNIVCESHKCSAEQKKPESAGDVPMALTAGRSRVFGDGNGGMR